MQDGGSYYAGYPPPPRPPPPGMMMDPHYPPPPISLPTSATRSNQTNWQPAPAPPPWGPDGHPMAPPPGMYMPSYYPSPYYRHPGMPLHAHQSHFPPQINPELLSQSNGQMSGVVPPESALRNTSPGKPEDPPDARQESDGVEMAGQPSVSDARDGESMRTTQMQGSSTGGEEGPDASTLMAAVALQAVLAYQKEHELDEAASRRGSVVPESESQMQPAPEAQGSDAAVGGQGVSTNISEALHDGLQVLANASDAAADVLAQPKVEPEANGEAASDAAMTSGVSPHTQPPDPEMAGVRQFESPSDPNIDPALATASASEAHPQSMEQLVTEDGMPMLNPAELLTQESLASPPP
ncbi:hypothetical protein BN946_scf184753.g6 [Trametes cinnabarina]|uniref:Uncharacterized protein n=1 Tax=Pycnoporus cinnabarinus TaxID=5643 RepID=A0A060SSY1_PYCCI|nr:hypothetical protein BN946_scf184753.g6 [Trametes cinnabarina]